MRGIVQGQKEREGQPRSSPITLPWGSLPVSVPLSVSGYIRLRIQRIMNADREEQ